MQKNFFLSEMLYLIDEPNRSACQKILEENDKLFRTAPGSAYNHQNWPGGYFDHIREVMNIAVFLYQRLDSLRHIPFPISDVLLVLFLHDIEKPWKYQVDPDGELRCKQALATQEAVHKFREGKLKQYGIVLNTEQENAMKYIHGEGEDHTPAKRVVGPLGAFCHICDVTSARIWFNHPLEGHEDSWWPVQRVNSAQ